VNKVVVNRCYGGFGLSLAACVMAEVKGLKIDWYDCNVLSRAKGVYRGSRHDPRLIAVIEELGIEASTGEYAQLEIIELKGNSYRIEEYDGVETLHEPHSMPWTIIETHGTVA
jgi:hypothetical protein